MSTLQIKNLFTRSIHRSINGVIKADQDDAESVWQELDEYVITRELDQHLRSFFESYLAALDNPQDASGRVGVWISGFFGSGKSHFLKILSYLLENKQVARDGVTRQAIDFFERKIADPMLAADIKRAIAADTDVLLFNIDSKADSGDGRDAILRVFLKVFNERLGFCGDHPHIAHMERYLDDQGKFLAFKEAFAEASGSSWEEERDAYHFQVDALAAALSQTLGQEIKDADAWVERFENDFNLNVESFARWVNDYLDKRGKDQRIVFLVDEVGQFIGQDTHLMLSLQTITENLGTVCGGRAWVLVTSQEDIDAVLGEVRASKANDFSKIQGRFKTRLSLSSGNVDEVIQRRLLDKDPEPKDALRKIYREKADILRNQLSFTNTGRTYKAFTDEDNFAAVYPFVPYQFQLVQRIFESIRKAGATGTHLARGERSLLDAFQSAAKAVGESTLGVLVPLYRFYPSIEGFLEGVVKSTIDNAAGNLSLQDFDTSVLKTLFLIRYVDEIKGNVDNLITLFIDEIDADRQALRKQIEDSLQRLEKETLVSRNGDDFFFLTNEERDISREIKEVDLTSADEARELGQLLFDESLRGQRKFRFSDNGKDFGLNRQCDLHPLGNRVDGDLLISVISPLVDDRDTWSEQRCILESSQGEGSVLLRLDDERDLARELRLYLQTDKFITRKNDGTLPHNTKRILQDRAEENRQRRQRLSASVDRLLREAEVYVAGNKLETKASSAPMLAEEALDYLVRNTFSKLGYIQHLSSDPQKEIQALLAAPLTPGLGLESTGEANPRALKEVSQHIELLASQSRRIVLHDLAESHYGRRPYGWPEWETVLLIVRLLLKGEVSLVGNGGPLASQQIWSEISTPARWRTTEIQRRQQVGSGELQKARQQFKDVFQKIAPDGEDTLYDHLQSSLTKWEGELKQWRVLAQNGQYPGLYEIDLGLKLIGKLKAAPDSFDAIQLFLKERNLLLDLSDSYGDLDNFYSSQKTAWDKLRSAQLDFQPNRPKLEKDGKAARALARIDEILSAKAPYNLIREGEGLIQAATQVNDGFLLEAHDRADSWVEKYIAKVSVELDALLASPDQRNHSLLPLQTLRQRIAKQRSLAHISQMQEEARELADVALDHLQQLAEQAAAKAQRAANEPAPKPPVSDSGSPDLIVAEPTAPVNNSPAAVVAPTVPIKKRRIIDAQLLAGSGYIETQVDIDNFLAKLRKELEEAVADNQRVEIR
ncbi:BREX system P-loop protein BrxC [Pseudomonas sp. WS 5021]|uniref:BREX system P-loop protein BrxC n=1 Tax=Pseudomonas sp. WS 5021 TaxID=2717490 RepID=UPI0021CCA241|nr:BREX system P-loop protein BrxC [Pseudomonas sp. WS 5021]